MDEVCETSISVIVGFYGYTWGMVKRCAGTLGGWSSAGARFPIGSNSRPRRPSTTRWSVPRIRPFRAQLGRLGIGPIAFLGQLSDGSRRLTDGSRRLTAKSVEEIAEAGPACDPHRQVLCGSLVWPGVSPGPRQQDHHSGYGLRSSSEGSSCRFGGTCGLWTQDPHLDAASPAGSRSLALPCGHESGLQGRLRRVPADAGTLES